MMRWTLDSHGAIDLVSREWKNFTGLSENELEGNNSRVTVHPQDQLLAARIIHSSIKEQAPFIILCRVRRPNGKYSWVTSAAAPSFAPKNGTFLGYLGTSEIVQPTNQPVAAMDLYRAVSNDSKHQIIMLDAVAEHILAARKIANKDKGNAIIKILDFALLSIGDMLSKASRR